VVRVGYWGELAVGQIDCKTIECMQMRGFRKQYWISWTPLISGLLTLDLDNFRFI